MRFHAGTPCMKTASPLSFVFAIERVCTPCAKIESFAHLRHPCYTARNGEKKGREKDKGTERERERGRFERKNVHEIGWGKRER